MLNKCGMPAIFKCGTHRTKSCNIVLSWYKKFFYHNAAGQYRDTSQARYKTSIGCYQLTGFHILLKQCSQNTRSSSLPWVRLLSTKSKTDNIRDQKSTWRPHDSNGNVV